MTYEHKNLWILFWVFAWLALGAWRLYPQKRHLLREFGYEKTNNFFIQLAKDGHKASRKLVAETKIFAAIGIVGGVILNLNAYL